MRLDIEAVTAARGGVAVTGPISFSLEGGAALTVTGENGVGKSTLLRTIAGLLPTAGGRIAFRAAQKPGEDLATSVGEASHYLGHRNAMKPGLTVGDNLRFWQAFLSSVPALSEPGSIEDALARVDLLPAIGVPYSFLSAGQQRRAAIARLLAAPRPLWILDEPTAALDAGSQAMFAALLADHLSAGGAVLAATHQPLGIAAASLHLERRRGHDAEKGGNAELRAAEGWL